MRKQNPLAAIATETLGKLDEVSAAARRWLNDGRALTIDSLVPGSQSEAAAHKLGQVNQDRKSVV